MIVWNLADHTEFSPPLASSLPPSHPCLSFPTSWIHFLSIKLQLQCPIWRIGIYQCVIDREFIIGCGLVTFQKQRWSHYSLKTIVITWPGRRVSLACIASAAFKGRGESIVAEGDRRHISKQTGLNAYIKSESFAGRGNISYPGVMSTCRPHPAIQEERGEGGLLFFAGLLKCPMILMIYDKASVSFGVKSKTNWILWFFDIKDVDSSIINHLIIHIRKYISI